MERLVATVLVDRTGCREELSRSGSTGCGLQVGAVTITSPHGTALMVPWGALGSPHRPSTPQFWSRKDVGSDSVGSAQEGDPRCDKGRVHGAATTGYGAPTQ